MKDEVLKKAGAPRMKDPHHDGVIEWCYWERRFFLRHGISNNWVAPKRAHVTPARVKVWMALLNMAGEGL